MFPVMKSPILISIGVLQHIGKHLHTGDREVSYVPFAPDADVRVLVETLSHVALLKERKGRRHKKDELGHIHLRCRLSTLKDSRSPLG